MKESKETKIRNKLLENLDDSIQLIYEFYGVDEYDQLSSDLQHIVDDFDELAQNVRIKL